MHTPRSSNLLEVLGSIPVEGIGLDELTQALLEHEGVRVRPSAWLCAQLEELNDNASRSDSRDDPQRARNRLAAPEASR
jgi:hypothetical protein